MSRRFPCCIAQQALGDNILLHDAGKTSKSSKIGEYSTVKVRF